MDAKAASEILIAAKIVASKEEFDTLRYQNDFVSKKGRDAVAAIMTHYCVDKKDKATKKRIGNWLNNWKNDTCRVDTPKRARMDVSYQEPEDPLDVTMESINEDDDSDVIEKLKADLAAKDDRIAELELELKTKVESNGSLFGKEARFNQFKPAMQLVAIKSLSKGITCTHVAQVLKLVAGELGFDEKDVPHVNTLNRWRDEKLPVVNQLMIDTFVDEAVELTLCVDDTSMAGSAKTSCILLVNEKLDHCLFDLVSSKATNGLELKKQMLSRIYRQPRSTDIIKKLKAIMSDMSSVQLLGNKLMIEQLGQSPLRVGQPKVLQLTCGMHTGKF